VCKKKLPPTDFFSAFVPVFHACQRLSHQHTTLARFNYFSLFLPPKDLNLQRAANTLFLVLSCLYLLLTATQRVHFHSWFAKKARDSFTRAPLTWQTLQHFAQDRDKKI
jgi:hypothetical protein